MHADPRMKAQLIALALLIGCQPAGAREDPPPLDDIMVRFHMFRSFDATRAIERLLVRGNLVDARALARSIAEAPDPGGLEVWARQTTLVRQRAIALAEAPGLDEACRRMARMAEACASCHVDTHAVVIFRNPPPAPADQDNVAVHMARHRWAADRLWEGMIGNADDSWRAGLDVLAQTPVQFPMLAGDRDALAKRLQQIVGEARQQKSTETVAHRARIYGEILVTCTACHSGASASHVR